MPFRFMPPDLENVVQALWNQAYAGQNQNLRSSVSASFGSLTEHSYQINTCFSKLWHPDRVQ